MVTELAAAQERAGNEVHVFTRMGKNQKEYECIDGVHYHRCSFDFRPNLVEEMKNMGRSMAWHFFQTEDYVGKFDVIHGHDWHVVPALDEIKKARNKRIIFTVHSTEYGRNGNNFGNDGIHGLEWYGTYLSNLVTVCTQVMKREVKEIHRVPEDKIRVVHNGIHAWKFNGSVDPWNDCKKWLGFGVFDPMIVFVGRMEYQKGPDLLLESIPDVLKDYPNAKFVFIGDGSMRAGLEGRMHQMHLEHAVRFTGYASDDWKTKIMKSSDVIVVPSRNEPFGIVVLEGWSCGKPVIATHGTGAGELIWHEVTGLRVFRNPNSIAWGIKRILSDLEHARWMGKNGRYAAEKAFNWDHIAEEMMKVYGEVV